MKFFIVQIGQDAMSFSGSVKISDLHGEGAAEADDDLPHVVVDPDEEGREGQVICASGGSVSSSNYSGSFCFGAVEVSSSPTASSSNYTWHAGPMTKVSP